jgi:hypothetical protein
MLHDAYIKFPPLSFLAMTDVEIDEKALEPNRPET